MGFFWGCCNRCFCDVVVVLLEMLQFVSIASILCCSRCSMLLQVFLFRALFHMLHTSVAIICFKCFSSFNLLLQQFVPCGCNNIFMVFQLLQPNVAVVISVLLHRRETGNNVDLRHVDVRGLRPRHHQIDWYPSDVRAPAVPISLTWPHMPGATMPGFEREKIGNRHANNLYSKL